MSQRLRWIALASIAAVAVVVAIARLMTGSDLRLATPPRMAASARPPGANPPLRNPLPPQGASGAVPDDAASGAEPEGGNGQEDTSGIDEDMHDASAEAWAAVDLDEVRRAMPDNVYFKLSAPTKDEEILAQRDAERSRWNTEYGKILSGTATDEEIRAYYDQRARLASDYMEFTTYLLDHYRDTLPERDVGLLELARRLNAARLQEISRQVEESFERKRQQDEARAAWLADEAEFGKADADSQ